MEGKEKDVITKEEARAKRENSYGAFTRTPHGKVPVMGRVGTAILDYYGYIYPQVENDPGKLQDIVCQMFRETPSDCFMYASLLIGQDNGDLLGVPSQTRIADDGITLQHLQKSPMKAEEYPLALADLESFEGNVLIRRKYPKLFESGVEAAARILEEVVDRGRRSRGGPSAGLQQRMEEEFGVVMFGDMRFMCATPGDIIFDCYRGFVGTLTDLRRHYAEMKELCDILWEKGYVRDFSTVQLRPDKYPLYMAHIPGFLSPKQYEDLCFRYFKKQVEDIAAQGSKLYLLAEGTWAPLFDFFLELPKDSVLMNVENDDVCDAYRAIGHHQVLMGGARLANLKMRSVEENVAYARKAIDTCAPGNAFVFCTDKAWCCKGDVNDTLVEVFKFADGYGKY